MVDSTSLQILVQLKDEATKGLETLGGKMKQLSGISDEATSASKAFGIGLLAVGAAAVGFGVVTVKAAAEAQAQLASMDATLQTLGATGIGARAQILKMSEAVVKLGFDDEDAAVSIARLYQRTHDLSKAQELNNIAMDLARAKHIDLAMASNLVGLVLSGNSRVLKQFGIDIKDTASPMEALGILQERVSGQADAFSKTFAGQGEVMKQNYQNLKEEIGNKLIPVLTSLLEVVNTFITDVAPKWVAKIQEIITWFSKHKEIIIIVAGAIVGALVPAFIALATTIITVTIPAFLAMAVALAPFIIGGLIIGGIIAGIYLIITNWELIKNKALEIWTAIADFFKGIWADITGTFEAAINWITDKFNGLMALVDKVKAAASAVGNFASNTYNSAANFITGKRALGGPVMAGASYLVGEQGPEIFVPNNGGSIVPNNKIGGAQTVVNLVITGNTLLDSRAAEKIGDLLVKKLGNRLALS